MPDLMVGTTRLTYDLSGEQGPCVVFLNGIAMSIGHWKPMIQALGGSYRCLRHDFRGQTLSDKPEGPYSFGLHARDLVALMDFLGIEKAHIVGTSYGSEVGMAFAADFPERCLSLAVIDGVSELDPVLRAAVESWKATALTDPVAFYKTLLPWTYSSAYLAANAATLKAREEAMRSFHRIWFEGFAALCDAFFDIDLTPRLKDIRCPCLVLVGEKDILKHRGFAEIIARGIPGARLSVLEGLGHAAVIESPELVARALKDFLQGARS